MSEIPKVVLEERSAPPQASEAPAPTDFVTAGHAILFQDNDAHRCDVCANDLDDPEAEPHDEDADESGFDVRGRGLLVWSRGGERRYQEPPLCPACAAAIGVSALQRWEIEEEEG